MSIKIPLTDEITNGRSWWDWSDYFHPDPSVTSDLPITREDYDRRQAMANEPRRGTAPRKGLTGS